MNRYSRRNRFVKSMPKPKKRAETMGVRNVRSTTRSSTGRPVPRPHETEEEAIIRRFHDAQRMARFRAKRKKAMEEAQAKAQQEASKLAEIAVFSELRRRNVILQIAEPIITVPSPRTSHQSIPGQSLERTQTTINVPSGVPGQSKYSQLLGIIEELGRDIRLTYAGSRTSAERLKIGISRAKMLVRDCLLETELINSKQ